MSRKFFSLFFVIVLFLTACGDLFAQQNAQELRLGAIITGNLNSREEIWYRVRTAENCFLTIETLGSTDTYLELYDSQLNLIRENDDGGDNSNAKIELLAAGGSNYLVKLRGYDSESGPFRIMADSSPLPNIADIGADSVLSGNLLAGQKQFYRVRTTGAGFFTVETSGNLDTYLEAYDSSFKFIDSNDDWGDSYNSHIELYVENNKIYYFVLRGYSSDDTGPYRILTSFMSVTGASTNNISRTTAAAINLAEAATVFFTNNQSRWYVCRVTQAGIVSLVVRTAGSIDTLLYLYDNQGNLIEQDDDSGEGNNAFITTRVNAGTYYIEVKEYSGGTGRCTLYAETR